jgi:hypothetical protein
LQFLGGLYAALFLASAENQIRAHLSQPFGHLSAEADRTAGNDGHAAG